MTVGKKNIFYTDTNGNTTVNILSHLSKNNIYDVILLTNNNLSLTFFPAIKKLCFDTNFICCTIFESRPI